MRITSLAFKALRGRVCGISLCVLALVIAACDANVILDPIQNLIPQAHVNVIPDLRSLPQAWTQNLIPQAHASTFSLSSVPVGAVVQTGDLKFVKVNDNNLLVSLQSLTTTNGESPLSLPKSAGLNLTNYQIDGQTELAATNLWTNVATQTKNGITLTNNGDGSVTLNGTLTASIAVFSYSVSIPNGSYTLSATSNGTMVNSNVLQIDGTNEAGTQDIIRVDISMGTPIQTTTNTTTAEIKRLMIIVSGTAGSTTLTNYTVKPTLTQVTPSPSPTTPVELQNLGEYNQTSGKYDVTTTNLESPQFLQTWQGCDDIATPTGLNHSKIVTLTDARDGKQYRVAKFADGNCWMLDNLKYGGTGVDGCAGKTTFNGCGNNTSSYCGGTSSAPGTGVSLYGPWTSSTTGYTSTQSFYGDCRDSAAGASGYCATNDCGYYYSWQAAMQDATAWYNNSAFVQPTEPIQGICPAGWILPTKAGTTSFQNLANSATGYTTTNFWQRDLTTADTTLGWLGLYSGFSLATGGLNNQGSYGGFWSSTSVSLANARNLYFSSTNAYPTDDSYKYYGFSVRCVQRPTVTQPEVQYLQTWTGCDDIETPTGLNHSDIVTLTDSRDGKQYRVAKFADGNCWMLDNLKYGGTGVDGCAGKTTFNGCGNNTSSYCGGTSEAPGTGVSLYGPWSGTNTSTTAFYGDCVDAAAGASGYCATNDCGYYYSWQAAMQDATAWYNNADFVQPTEPVQGICPAGWILPTNAGTTSFQNLANSATGYTTTNFWQRDLTTADATLGFLGLYSGYSGVTGGLSGQGILGYFWSSTSYFLTGARNLIFYSANAYPTDADAKYNGFSVRCLQNPAVASNTATFSLSAPLRCVGSGTSQVCDYIDFVNQRVVRNVAEVELAGSNISGMNNSHNAFTNDIYPFKSYFVVCSHFKSSNTYNGDIANNSVNHYPDNRFYFMPQDAYTLADFQAFFDAQAAAGTPVTVQYQLATPTYEYLSLPVLRTTAGTNNVTVGNGTIVEDQKVQSSWIKTNYWWE